MGIKPGTRRPTDKPVAKTPPARLSNWDGIELPHDERWTVERSIPGDTKVQAFDMKIKQGRFQHLKNNTKRLTLIVEYEDFETDTSTT